MKGKSGRALPPNSWINGFTDTLPVTAVGRRFWDTEDFPDRHVFPFSVNDEVIHGIPGNRVLRAGDIVSMDLGINLNGFFSDMARTFPVGTVSNEAKRLMDVTSECLDEGIRQAVCGNRIKDISAAVFSRAGKYGVVRDYCGHGVGLKLHEDPEVPNYCSLSGKNPRLKSGMVIAIEPMINAGGWEVDVLDDGWTVVTRDGSLSAHFEDTVAVFPDRTEILTRL